MMSYSLVPVFSLVLAAPLWGQTATTSEHASTAAERVPAATERESAGTSTAAKLSEASVQPLADGKKSAADCVSYDTQARFSGAGYDHLVHVKNSCKRTARCAVHTNVNPSPVHVSVEPRAVETVVTFRGSPARTFSAVVNCQLQ